ncbi:MAG: HIT family protein [Saprospirales bacterium]|nr:HIT family protein [Saprospirales bacterium]MBK8490336.1 HIT family protein [Saprospirales bacterium]
MACIFCQIIEGKIPSHKVYEDDLVMAFMDAYPINPGHVLVVPKQHSELVSGLPAETAGRLFQVAQTVETAIRASGVRCDASNLVLNNGQAAGQEIPHAHLHIIPRHRGDGIRFQFQQKKAGREELDSIALEIIEKIISTN